MTLVHIVGVYSVVSKESVRRIWGRQTGVYVAAFKTIATWLPIIYLTIST